MLWLLDKTFFDQPHRPVRNNLIAYDSIGKTAEDQRGDYIIGYLLDYKCFKKYYKNIHLNKQQVLDVDLKAIQQINFTGNLNQIEGAAMCFITEEAKETILDFWQGTIRVLGMSSSELNTACSTIYFCLI